MKLKVGKLILLPIVAIPTMFFAFGFSKFTTYRSIVLEDLRVNEKYTYIIPFFPLLFPFLT